MNVAGLEFASKYIFPNELLNNKSNIFNLHLSMTAGPKTVSFSEILPYDCNVMSLI